MTKEQEMALIREMGELRDMYSLCDESAENKARGERIKAIRQELIEAGALEECKPRANRRPSVLNWR